MPGNRNKGLPERPDRSVNSFDAAPGRRAHNVYYVTLKGLERSPNWAPLAQLSAAATVPPPKPPRVLPWPLWCASTPSPSTFGEQRVLVDAGFSIEPGERVCLIGRNGAGKSTTLRLITGEQGPDDGTVEMSARLRSSLLEQKLADESAELVRDYVAHGMASQLARIARFEALTAANPHDRTTLHEIETLQREIDAGGGWNIGVRVGTVISELGLPSEQRMSDLSGGWRRRAALARALVSNPELLMLDEPTNHLDISTIEWLEDAVRNHPGAVLFVTHDRSFVERVATRIVDIDRGSCAAGPADTATTSSRKHKATRPRIGRTRCSTRSSPRKRSGFAKASKPARRATRDACARSRSCVTFAQRA